MNLLNENGVLGISNDFEDKIMSIGRHEGELSLEESLHDAADAINRSLGGDIPDVIFLVAAMRDAFKKHDVNYFRSAVFHRHCEVLNMNYSSLVKSILDKMGEI
jgi:hypothetical protein